MVEMMNGETSDCWWFEGHEISNPSPWLQTTIAGLRKVGNYEITISSMNYSITFVFGSTSLTLKLIEEDADNFAERAEMFYKKNKTQEDQLMQKDAEKREVIRQLTLTVGVLKEENMKLIKYIARDSKKLRLIEGFFGKVI
ncbi:protein NETWORKED 3C-like [Mangifera indica]|uniref:protein NETWORKED 3C-like n=1 Tax=Mangifera indica TaxID=29780 RepID=UPI001CFC33D3|nr:protein NETWORKED 3C-like [Mangifera indica]